MNASIRVLSSLNKAANGGYHHHQLLRILQKQIHRAFSCQFALLYLIDDDQHHLKCRRRHFPIARLQEVEKLFRKRFTEIKVPLDGVNSYIDTLNRRQLQTITQSQSWFMRLLKTVDEKRSSDKSRLPSEPFIILFPILAGDKTLGLLEMITDHALTASDLSQIERISSEVSVILKRLLKEEQLREHEDYFRSIPMTAKDAIFVKDHKLRYVFVNPAWERVFDVKSSAVLGLNDEQLFGEGVFKNSMTIDRKVLRGVTVEREQTELAKGDFTTYHIIKSPMYNSNGKIIGLCGIARDITERKKMEEALKESEQRYRNFLDNLGDAAYEADVHGFLTYINKKGEELAGCPKSDLLRKSYLHLLTKESQKIAKKAFKTTLGGGHPEYELTFTDGKSAQFKNSPFKDQFGKIVGVYGTARDVTRQKYMMDELQHVHQIYRKAIENAQGVPYRLNFPEQSYEFIGEGIESLLGIPANQFNVQKMRKLIKAVKIIDSQAPSDPKEYSQAFLDGQVKIYRADFYICTPSGQTKWLSDCSVPIKDEVTGKVIGSLGILQDITDRIRAEEALKKSEEQYRVLVEKAGVAILVSDRSDRFLYYNDKFADMFGYTCEGMEKASIRSIIHPEDVRKVMRHFRSHFKGSNVPERFEFKGVMQNGSAIDCEVSIVNIQEGDRIIGTRSYLWDISERKHAEAAEQQYIRNIEFLSKTTIGFVGLPADQDIYKFIAEQLQKNIENSLILVNSFDERSAQTCVRAISGLEKLSKQLSKIFEKEIKGTQYQITEALKKRILAGKLEKVEGGIHELSFAKLPIGLCRQLESTLQISEIWGMGLTRRNRLLGTAIIILRDQAKLKDISFIETFINQASIALQRRRVAEVLRQSENNYRLTLDSMGEAIHVVDANLKIVLMNKAFYEWNRELGIQTDVVGKYLFDIFTFLPDSVKDEYNDVCKTGKIFISEEDTKIAGREYHTITRKIPIFEGTRVSGVTTIIHNITERKHAEQMQKISYQISNAVNTTKDLQELFRSIQFILSHVMDTTNFFIALIDKEKKNITLPYFVDEKDQFTTLPAEQTLTGYVIKQGKPLLITSENKEQNTPKGLEKPVGTPSQSWLGVPLRIDKEIIGAVVVQSYKDESSYTDKHLQLLEFVSDQIAMAIDRKKAEDALRESEEKYSNLFLFSNDGIILHAQDGTILDANERVQHQFGYTKNEITGLKIYDLHPLSSRETSSAAFKKVAQNGYVQFEIEFLKKDGSVFPAEVSSSLFEVSGKKIIQGIIRDITDRRRVEGELKKVHEIYRRSIENARGVPYIYNYKKQRYDFIAEGCISLIGIPSSEVSVDTWKEMRKRIIINDSDAPSELSDYANAYIQGSLDHYQVDMLLETANGQEKWLSDDAVPIKDECGRVIATMGILQDITERKVVEEKIRESEAQFKSLYSMMRLMCDNVPDLIWAKDLDQRYIFTNTAMCEKLLNAADTDEPLGKTDMFFALRERTAHPEIPKWHTFGEICANSDNVVMKHRMPQRFDEYGNVKGEFMYLDVYKAPFWDLDGNMLGTVGCGRIVTKEKVIEDQRRKAEAELQNIHDIYRKAIESAQGIPYRRNFLTDTYDFWGEGVEDLLGIPAKQVTAEKIMEMTRTFKILLPHAPRDIFKYGFAFRKRRIDKFQVDQLIINSRGEKRWINDCAIPIIDEKTGKVIGSLGILQNITSRKKTEENLRRSQEKLRQLASHLQSIREEERTQIAREIHDELGQMLTALKMELFSLRKKLPDKEPSIAENVRGMSALIDSTIQSVKKISSQLRPTLLDDLGLTAAIEWQTQEFKKRVGVECELTIDQPDIVLDKDKSTALFRIFQETLTNISRHALATKVWITFRKKDNKIILTVKDNGVGLTKDSKSSPKSFGIIGMRERAHSLGGNVIIKGVKGKGTAVLVSIPLRRKND